MLKILFTIFLIILIPIYTKTYGFSNFLWLSDIGLFLTFFALWFKSSLLISMAAVGILPVEIIWCIDFFLHIITKRSYFEITNYMFDKNISIWIRSLSLFHIALPIILINYLIEWRYDYRAFYLQTCLVWLIFLLTYFLSPDKSNINWI